MSKIDQTLAPNDKKKIKVLLLVNTLTSVNSFIYHNHIAFFGWTTKNHPEIEFQFFTPHRMSIDAARNTAAEYALQLEMDYLMFIDDDVMIPRNSLKKLIDNDKDICAGFVIIRGMPFNVMAFKFGKRTKQHKNMGFYNDLPKNPDGKLRELVRCDAVGFSLALIKTDLLKKLSKPYFITGTANTEDVYFCLKAKHETNNKTSIFMDTSLECGHLLNPEPVGWSNRLKLKAFYESLEPQESKTKEKGRSKLYFSRNLENLK